MNIILVCASQRGFILTRSCISHFASLRKRRGEHRATRSKANLYIIRRRLYRMADLAEAAPGVGSFNYSYSSVMQFADTGNFRPSAVNHVLGICNRPPAPSLLPPPQEKLYSGTINTLALNSRFDLYQDKGIS